MAINTNLLGGMNRVQVPYIKVTIGEYVFGVYQKTEALVNDQGFYQQAKITYPNYIHSLSVVKINGQVNQYQLSLTYPIKPGDDPNFFEKVFSSISKTRKIVFSYGDINMPTYIYKEEEAIVTDVKSNFDQSTAKIVYNVSAISSCALSYSAAYTIASPGVEKPSKIIKYMIANNAYGLRDLFYGMGDIETVKTLGLIASDDTAVHIETKVNISALDYLKYLVSIMIPDGQAISGNSGKIYNYYALTIHDEILGETTNDSKTEFLGGPYFKVVKVGSYMDHSDAYEVDVGFPSQNIVLSFNIDNNENYSIFYDWQTKLNNTEYVWRLDDEGRWEQIYAPTISSNNDNFQTRPQDAMWWNKVTQYPISATLKIKGLLRPATLMEYVKVNVLFFGRKHIASGMYVVTKQVDTVDGTGFTTTLNLTKLAGESESEYDS